MAKKNEENDGTVTLVLNFDMHCEGCAGKVVNFVRSLDGVESVQRKKNDWKKMTVVGNVDPVKLCENVERKIQKKVELISPATTKQNDGGEEHKKKQNDVVRDKNNHKQFPVTTTVLKVSLNCRGCIRKIQKLVSKTEGFVEMSIDKINDLVTVKGAMDMNVLTATLQEKLKRKVEIVHVTGGSGGKKGKGSDSGKKGKGGGGDSGGRPTVAGYFAGQGQYTYPQYVNRSEYTFNYMDATQMFNDENPNACVVV